MRRSKPKNKTTKTDLGEAKGKRPVKCAYPNKITGNEQGGGGPGRLERRKTMAEVICFVEGCKNHNSFSNTCRLEDITVSDSEVTAAGFIQKCEDYEEAAET